jgi:hypothetical protein
MRKETEEVNEFKDQNERRKFYRASDNLKKGFQPSSMAIETKTVK